MLALRPGTCPLRAPTEGEKAEGLGSGGQGWHGKSSGEPVAVPWPLGC